MRTWSGKLTFFHSATHHFEKPARWSATLSAVSGPPNAQTHAKANWYSTSRLSGGGPRLLDSCVCC